jgi:hypothetical protein
MPDPITPPAEPARESATISKPPRPVPPVVPVPVQIADKIGDAVGALCIAYLASTGKLTGFEAAAFIVGLLGGLEGLRKIGLRFGAHAGGGAAAGALLFKLGLPTLAHVAVIGATLVAMAGGVR